jgi:hypothetical protein
VTVAYKRGAAGTCDRVFSLIVRARGRCEFVDGLTGYQCTAPGQDAAHIIGRGRTGTRWVEDNAWCLCRFHHALVDVRPDEKMRMVHATIGLDRYLQLWDEAQAYTSARRTTKTLFVQETVARLKARRTELGLAA